MRTLRPPAVAALAVVVAGLLAVMGAVPAAAQDGPADQDDVTLGVTISFDVGPYDRELRDHRVEAVEVAGDAAGPQAVTVELRDERGDLLWSAEVALTPPSTTIRVDRPVAVGDVASAGLSQPIPVVAPAGRVVPDVAHTTQGGGGSGQLALSMVVIIALVALIFRTPLPSASTARWTR